MITCVKCGDSVSLKKESIFCSKCNYTYESLEGIPILLNDNYGKYQHIEKEYRVTYQNLTTIEYQNMSDFLMPQNAIDKFAVERGYYYRFYYHFGYVYNKFLSQIREYFEKQQKTSIKVLDVGTGLSNLLYVFIEEAKKYGITVEPFAIDIIHSGMARVKSIKKEPHINFICADAENLPFQEESFDFVFSINAIEHAGDLMISEMMRVLKDDGRLFVIGPSFYGQLTHTVLFGKRNRKYLLKGEFNKIDVHGVRFTPLKNKFVTFGGEILSHNTDNYFRCVQERLSNQLKNERLIKLIFILHNCLGSLFNNKILRELNFMQYLYIRKKHGKE